MRTTLIAAMAALALMGAACSSTSSTAETGGGGAATSSGCTADTATDLTADDPFTITIQDIAYLPDCVKVSSPAGLEIVNKDATAHTFTIDGTPVDVDVPPSETVSGKSPGFAPATYIVHCNIHTSMSGTVIVV
jgi:plastocyanin